MPNTKGGFWGVAVADHDNDEIILTKKYYAFGQFTRYIRPGFTIIGGTDNTLAALDKENNQLVIVATNTEAEDVTCDFDLSMFNTVGTNVQVIRTSGDMATGENWAELAPLTTYGKGFVADLKANSVTTYIVDGVTSTGSALTEIAVNTEMVTGSNPWNNDMKNGCTNVIDGKLDTFFDGVGNGYVQFDLGKVYNLDAIAYAPRAGYEKRCVDASFMGSADGENWYTLYTVSETPAAQLTYVTKRAFANDVAVRYVKYAVPEGDYNCNIAEIKLFGTEASDAEVLESVIAVLNKKLTEYKAIEQGYYTDGSYNALQAAIAAAENSSKDTVAAVQALIAALDEAYAGLEVGDAIPTEVTEVLPLIVVESGKTPALQETVKTKTKGGSVVDSVVNWNTGYDYSKDYATVLVQGTVAGTDLKVTQQVEVIPEASKLVYYIDCGTESTGSATFDKVKTVAANLKNTVSDQTYDSAANTWGVGGANNLKTDNSYTSATEKKYTGFYGNNNSTEPISYSLALEPGNYKLTMQAYEWWSGPRTMDFEVVIVEGGATRVVTLAEEVSVSSSSRNAQASGVITLSEATTVTVNLTPTTHEASAISFLAVETTSDTEQGAGGEVDDTIDSIYGSLSAQAVVVGTAPALPEKIQVKTKDNRIMDAAIVWNSYTADDFATPYSRVTVEGAVTCPVTGKEISVSTFVEVVPENLVYFIDCAMADSGSLAYNAVKELLPELRNQAADQQFDGSNGWGYGGKDGSYTDNSAKEKYFAGHYGANKSSTPVTYTLPLSAGAYDITMFVHNWWGTRTMSVEAVYTDAESNEVVIPIQQNYTINGHKETAYQTLEKSLVIPNDTVVTLKFTADSGQDGAIINFIGIVKSEANADALESVYGTVPLQVTTVGTEPSLPATVQVSTVGGEIKDAAITWDYSSADYSVPYSRVEVSGTVDGTELQTTVQVEVIPENLVYFIDGGKASTGSDIYEAVKKSGVTLQNEVCDKDYNGTDGWGVSGYGGAYTGTSAEHKELTGYYGKNDGTPIVYTLPLAAGTYNITAQMHEWWSGPRTLDVKVVYTTAAGEQTEVIAEAVQVSGSERDKTVSGTITLAEDATVALQFVMSAGKEAPVVSFVGVEQIASGEDNPGGDVSGGDVSGGDSSDKDDTEDDNGQDNADEDTSDAGDDADDANTSGEVTPTVDWNALDSQVASSVPTTSGNVATGSQTLKNINVTTGRNTIIPARVLASLQQKPVTLAMHVHRDVALSLTGLNIPRNMAYADMNLALGVSTAPEAAVKEKTANAIAYKQIAFVNRNPFEARVNIHFGLGKENAQKKANLYMYSDVQKSYVYAGSFVITENGQAMFGLDRRGDYLVTVTDAAPQETGEAGYTVQSGDTLSAIAYKNNMKLSELLAKNPAIANRDLIYPGQKIVVK